MKKQLQEVISLCLSPYLQELGLPQNQNLIELQDTPDSSKGDFALNTAMRLAKPAKLPPLKIAEKLAGLLQTQTDWFKQVVAAPPGFVNLYLSDAALCRLSREITGNLELSLTEGVPAQKVIVDYSSVNIAKQMHVGHLRSTIIGDVLARVLASRGHEVIRQNHLGDWGLPIAMVLWKTQPILRSIEAAKKDPQVELTLNRLEELYREASHACANDQAADRIVHEILVQLQNGDQQLLDDWHTITRISMAEVYRIYTTLDVTLKPEHERGESFYRDLLAKTVDKVKASGKLEESQGAQCVFLEHFKTKDGKPLPVIVQKSDGGYNYETFDLAGICYRIDDLQANRLIYVTDARQALHFAQVFDVAHTCGWTHRPGREISLEHVPFGSVLGEDNKPLKTRSGENVKLADLLAEATERALNVVKEKNPELPDDKKQSVARAVGIGAVKYADLSQNRNNDYVFSWERMLAFNGNTAPYLQYAHARICSIFRKSGLNEAALPATITACHTAERALAMKLARFPEMVGAVERELRPHILCNYLFDLANVFTTFYDQCPVLAAGSEAEKLNRLALCGMTRSVLRHGLSLLGITAPEEM